VIVVVVVGVVIVLVLLAIVVSYNRFVRQRNLVAESWRQVDVELQRRHDLIPNLVEVVRGYAAHERQVLEQVTQARTDAERARTDAGADRQRRASAENQLSTAVGAVVAVAEGYPQLKADQNFLALQHELVDTEDRIAAGRRFYNGNVRALNTRVEAFPSSLVAGWFHFEHADYFPLDDPKVRDAVRVDLGGPA
jgi:LemA protein